MSNSWDLESWSSWVPQAQLWWPETNQIQQSHLTGEISDYVSFYFKSWHTEEGSWGRFIWILLAATCPEWIRPRFGSSLSLFTKILGLFGLSEESLSTGGAVVVWIHWTEFWGLGGLDWHWQPRNPVGFDGFSTTPVIMVVSNLSLWTVSCSGETSKESPWKWKFPSTQRVFGRAKLGLLPFHLNFHPGSSLWARIHSAGSIKKLCQINSKWFLHLPVLNVFCWSNFFHKGV